MKVHCDVIRDLLPLYVEELASPATRELVEEHLKECESCSAALEAMKQAPAVPERETESLRRVRKAIRKRKWLAVLTVFFFLVTVLSGGVMLLDAEIYLSAEEAVEAIWLEENTVKIRWDSRIIGTGSQCCEEDSGNYAVTGWTNLQKILFPTERIPYEALDEEIKAMISSQQYAAMDNTSTYTLAAGSDRANVWYYDFSGDGGTLILDGGMPHPNSELMKDGNRIKIYVYGLAVVSALCFTAGNLLRKGSLGQLLTIAGIAAGSAALSGVIVTAGALVDIYGRFTEMLVDSTVVAVPMVLFGLLSYGLLRLNRQDKGL